MTDLVGGTVLNGKYAISRLLAEGGMSKIYLGNPLQGAALVAIKQLRESASASDYQEDLHQFHAEFRILRSLQHPSLPRALEFFEEGGRHYLVEEYVPGETLESRILTTGRLRPGDAVAIAVGLLDVLEYLHRRRIIYRDLKPSNIVLGRDGGLRLIDFGAAREWREGAAHDTVPLGTPGFASPEHYGRSQTDARSDIFSVGALLHYMLTGRDPQDSPPWTFEPPHVLCPDVPTALSEIAMTALEVDAERRFQHVGAMRRAMLDLALMPTSRTGSGHHLATLRRRLQYAQPQDYYHMLETLGVGLFGIFFFAVSLPAWFAHVPLPHPLVGMWLTAYAFAHPYSTWKKYRSLVVEIFAEGMKKQSDDGVQELLWNDVVKLRITDGKPHGGYGGWGAYPDLTHSAADIYTRTGDHLHFDGGWPGLREVVRETIRGAGLVDRSSGLPRLCDLGEKIYERVV